MNSLRKWLYRPKRDDTSLMAQFYYADEELNLVAEELDSFDGRKDPERCTSLVNQLRQAQDKVLNICIDMMEKLLPNERASRDFRVKFPDDVMQETLAGQLWFGAECLAAGSSILNRESESIHMRPLAKAVTKTIENVRNQLREQCLKPLPEYTEKIRESLKIFDRLFADFELSYVSAMVPVKTGEEYEMLQNVVVLFSNTLQRAVELELILQEQIDNCDPALMFTVPRLAIVAGLIIFPDGPLRLERDSKALSELFRPFKVLLLKIRELLWTMSPTELRALEKCLCSMEEPNINLQNMEAQSTEIKHKYEGPKAYTSDFVHRFYSNYPSCRNLTPDMISLYSSGKKSDRSERKRERTSSRYSRIRARQEKQSEKFLSRLTGIEDRSRIRRRARRETGNNYMQTEMARDFYPTAFSSIRESSPRSNARPYRPRNYHVSENRWKRSNSERHLRNSRNRHSPSQNYSRNRDSDSQVYSKSRDSNSQTFYKNRDSGSRSSSGRKNNVQRVGPIRSSPQIYFYEERNAQNIESKDTSKYFTEKSENQDFREDRNIILPSYDFNTANTSLSVRPDSPINQHINDVPELLSAFADLNVQSADHQNFSCQLSKLNDDCHSKKCSCKTRNHVQSSDVKLDCNNDDSLIEYQPLLESEVTEQGTSVSQEFAGYVSEQDSVMGISSKEDNNVIQDSMECHSAQYTSAIQDISECTSSSDEVATPLQSKDKFLKAINRQPSEDQSYSDLHADASQVATQSYKGFQNSECSDQFFDVQEELETQKPCVKTMPSNSKKRHNTATNSEFYDENSDLRQEFDSKKKICTMAPTEHFDEPYPHAILENSKHNRPQSYCLDTDRHSSNRDLVEERAFHASHRNVKFRTSAGLQPDFDDSELVRGRHSDLSSSGSTSPHHSSAEDDEEVALAMQAAEIAVSWKARERFTDSNDLIQRLFVCISGVADQLQTNCASDMRRILRSVFVMNQTPDEDSFTCNENSTKESQSDDATSSNGSEEFSVESAEDALAIIGTPELFSPSCSFSDNLEGHSSPGHRQRIDPDFFDDIGPDFSEDTTHDSGDESQIPGISRLLMGKRCSVAVPPSVFHEHAFMQYSSMSPPSRNPAPITTDNDSVSNTSQNVTLGQNLMFPIEFEPGSLVPSTGRESLIPVHNEASILNSETIGSIDSQVGSNEASETARRYSIVQKPPAWIPDDDAPRCMACCSLFTMVRRRHHCRNCGKVFCGHCSRHGVPLPHFGIWKNVRVCNACFLYYVTTSADGSSALS